MKREAAKKSSTSGQAIKGGGEGRVIKGKKSFLAWSLADELFYDFPKLLHNYYC